MALLPPPTFESELDQFQFDVMETWFNRTGQEIGLSIQKERYLQDESDPTRIERPPTSGPYHYMPRRINFFCKQVQNKPGHLEKCNALDTSLKEIATNPGFNPLSIACRCHAGVSNVLIPYRHQNDKDRVWFVFIGQFLLRAETSDELRTFSENALANSHISDLESQDIVHKHKENVKPGIWISKNTYNRNFRTQRISYISFVEFLLFREFALTRFESFLAGYYKTPVGRKQIEDWSQETRPTQRLLQQATEFLAWFNALDKPPKFQGQVAQLTKTIMDYAYSGAMAKEEADDLGNWLRAGRDGGKIQDSEWLAAGGLLVAKLDALPATFSNIVNG